MDAWSIDQNLFIFWRYRLIGQLPFGNKLEVPQFSKFYLPQDFPKVLKLSQHFEVSSTSSKDYIDVLRFSENSKVASTCLRYFKVVSRCFRSNKIVSTNSQYYKVV